MPSLHGCDHLVCQIAFTVWLVAAVFCVGTYIWAFWYTREKKSTKK